MQPSSGTAVKDFLVTHAYTTFFSRTLAFELSKR